MHTLEKFAASAIHKNQEIFLAVNLFPSFPVLSSEFPYFHRVYLAMTKSVSAGNGRSSAKRPRLDVAPPVLAYQFGT